MTNHGMGDLQEVSVLALKAGTDMDMVGEGFLSNLKKSLNEGKVTRRRSTSPAGGCWRQSTSSACSTTLNRYCDLNRAKSEIFTEEHNRIARETAAQTFVLLKNDNNLLPWRKREDRPHWPPRRQPVEHGGHVERGGEPRPVGHRPGGFRRYWETRRRCCTPREATSWMTPTWTCGPAPAANAPSMRTSPRGTPERGRCTGFKVRCGGGSDGRGR